jgi:hypothetical protein
MNISQTGWRLVAFFVAAGFFWLATRVDVYHATSPYGLVSTVFGSSAPSMPHPWWLALHIWVRKFYSIVAFALVGLTADKALGAAARPRLRALCLVALYSAAIELAQHHFGPHEPLFERVLDVACGAAGGYIGVFALELIERRPQSNAR